MQKKIIQSFINCLKDPEFNNPMIIAQESFEIGYKEFATVIEKGSYILNASNDFLGKYYYMLKMLEKYKVDHLELYNAIEGAGL